MSRSQFILGIALLVVSATLAFTISFKNEASAQPAPVASTENDTTKSKSSRRPASSSRPGTSQRERRTFYEVTVSDRSLSTLAVAVEEDSIQELEALSERYNLTTSQRRGIFPLIAARHPQYQEGMVINGSLTPAQGPTSSLESAMYPLLDEEQQEDLEDDVLADNEWWGEIISQLRDDLDQAISTGEMVPTIDPTPGSNTPAIGDGEEIDNPDINLDSLFGK